jgi:hypothetical protein
MNPEDRLRELLRLEAASVVPAGDGLTKIQARLARRKVVRRWLVPSAALLTAGVAASFVLIAQGDTRKPHVLEPIGTPTPTPTPSATPPPPPTGGFTGTGMWPFGSQTQADSWDAATMPWAEDNKAVVEHFVRDWLALPGITVTQSCVSCNVLGLQVGSRSVGEVDVDYYVVAGKHVFTVTHVGGTDLTISAPAAGEAISSPTDVRGRITGVDENVQLRLLSTAGSELASAGAPAGTAVPWQGSLTWTASDWATGGIVGVTRSARDGSVSRVVAVPVRRSTTSAAASFAGLVDGHVSLFDAVTGHRLRQLTYPQAGSEDVGAGWSAGSLVWVRHPTSGCGDELNRLDGTTASTVHQVAAVKLSWPAISADGGWVAWVEQPCSGGAQSIVVLGGGAPARRIAVPSGSTVGLHDVRDDGAVLISLTQPSPSGPGVQLLPGGALDLSGLTPLNPAAACAFASGAAFDGDAPVAFESCGSQVRLVRFSAAGARTAADKAFSAEPPDSVSVRDGHVLVWLFGGDRVGEIATYSDGTTKVIITNDGCTSISPQTGCVKAPSW